MTQKFSGYLYNFQLHYILIVELKKNKVEVCSYMRQGTKIGGLQMVELHLLLNVCIKS